MFHKKVTMEYIKGFLISVAFGHVVVLVKSLYFASAL